MLEMQAEKLFSEGDYEGALKIFTDITGTRGALLRWSDEKKFEQVRGRQAASSRVQRARAPTGRTSSSSHPC